MGVTYPLRCLLVVPGVEIPVCDVLLLEQLDGESQHLGVGSHLGVLPVTASANVLPGVILAKLTFDVFGVRDRDLLGLFKRVEYSVSTRLDSLDSTISSASIFVRGRLNLTVLPSSLRRNY